MFDLRPFDFPPRRGVMILCEDFLNRFELEKGELSAAALKRLECLKYLKRWGSSVRRHFRRFLVNPVEQYVMERPVLLTRE